jgi:Co/Zn/Cd efflux system component
MSDNCCQIANNKPSTQYKKVLVIALVVNALMFIAEVITSYYSNSVSLLADSVDFLGDSANYAISIFVLNKTLATRARASILKSASMAAFGIGVICSVIYQIIIQAPPHAQVMGTVGTIALIANLFVAALLFKYRDGDSNMRSVWLCTRNDAIGNLLVILAAIGVALTGTLWPDLFVGLIMGLMGLSSAAKIYKHARKEIKQQP